jgi:hypothetical protein
MRYAIMLAGALTLAASASAGPPAITATIDGRQLTIESWQWGPRQTTSLTERGGHSMLGASDRSPRTEGAGSLLFKGALPGCTVGQRYGGMQFAASGLRYELKDVVISNCAPGQVTLGYSKVTVRGWDPKKKEE